ASARTYVSFFVVVPFLVLVFFVAFLAADTSELPSATGWSTVACAFASTEDLVSRATALPAAIAADPARSDATRTGTDIFLSMWCPFSLGAGNPATSGGRER